MFLNVSNKIETFINILLNACRAKSLGRVENSQSIHISTRNLSIRNINVQTLIENKNLKRQKEQTSRATKWHVIDENAFTHP